MAKTKSYTCLPQKTSARISALRIKNNMTQQELGITVSELSKRDTLYTVSAVSAWECGRRMPTEGTFKILASVFGVSIAYLKGLSDDPLGEAETSSTINPNENAEIHAVELDKDLLPLYDGKPVFVSFNNYEHKDQWFIYNVTKDTLIGSEFTINSSDPSIKRVFSFDPYLTDLGKCLSIKDLLICKTSVYVSMKSPDRQICSLYNGWYHNNENNTALINKDGLSLPYEGLNNSYVAFR